MTWQLGVDLGTTFTAAATYRDSAASIFPLGDQSAAIPSVVYVKVDGEILTGAAASRRVSDAPERLARNFKRRLGDKTPLFLGGAPFKPEQLTAELLKAVYTAAVTREGSEPNKIGLSHPANWGDYKQKLLREAVELAGIDPNSIVLVAEPEAAAISYATAERVRPGQRVAVYDLGGGTFDAAVLERTPDGFRVLPNPEGVEHLGGVDFDAAVFTHISRSIQDNLDELDYTDPATIKAVARLKRECTEAKEALSSDTDATVPVLLRNIQTEVRITRKEFEDLCRPAIQTTIEALNRALSSANISIDQISKILLVGGSSRIPLVAQMVQSELGRPIAVDAHPKDAIALGTVIKAAGEHKITGTLIHRLPDLSKLPGPSNTSSPIDRAASLSPPSTPAGPTNPISNPRQSSPPNSPPNRPVGQLYYPNPAAAPPTGFDGATSGGKPAPQPTQPQWTHQPNNLSNAATGHRSPAVGKPTPQFATTAAAHGGYQSPPPGRPAQPQHNQPRPKQGSATPWIIGIGTIGLVMIVGLGVVFAVLQSGNKLAVTPDPTTATNTTLAEKTAPVIDETTTTSSTTTSTTASEAEAMIDSDEGVTESVNFELGATSADVSGTLPNADTVDLYLVEAEGGQTMTIDLTSNPDDAFGVILPPDEDVDPLNANGNLTNDSVILPSSGIYTIAVGAPLGGDIETTYDLTISVL